MAADFVPLTPPFFLAGELASLVAAFIWAGSVTIYRHWGRDISSPTLNLFKCFVAFICLAVSLAIVRPALPGEGSAVLELMVSGIVGLAIGDTAFFAALRRLGAQATSCGWCLSPLFTVGFAMVYLNETLSAAKVAGVLITTAGVAGVMYFGAQRDTPMASLSRKALAEGIVYVLISAVAQAFGLVIARDAFQHTDVLWGTFLRMTPALGVLALVRVSPFLADKWRNSNAAHRFNDRESSGFSSRGHVIALASAAFFGTFIGLLLLSTGTKYAKAGLVAALTSTFPLWVIPIARIFLKEPTTWPCILCTILAVAGIGLMLVPGA
jgi:drug/metabolite transporter (DMT)-like permease